MFAEGIKKVAYSAELDRRPRQEENNHGSRKTGRKIWGTYLDWCCEKVLQGSARDVTEEAQRAVQTDCAHLLLHRFTVI